MLHCPPTFPAALTPKHQTAEGNEPPKRTQVIDLGDADESDPALLGLPAHTTGIKPKQGQLVPLTTVPPKYI